MNVAPVAVNNIGQTNKVNFSAQHERKKGGAGKAWSSAFLPGLGQFFDGRNTAGFGFLGGMLGLQALSFHIHKDLYKPFSQGDLTEYTKSAAKISTKEGYAAKMALLGMASFGLWIANIVDAYKGGQK